MSSNMQCAAELEGTEQREPIDLNDLKMELVNLVCASLLGEPRFNDDRDMRARWILELVEQVAEHDPEFILKIVLYVRDDLNIRSTANFLMAVAANTPACAPFLKKYFKKSVRLPSDWLDVAALYQMLPDKHLEGRALPSALRKAMIHKFPDFDGYQLAKYNKENSMQRKRKKARERAEKLKAQGLEAPPEPDRKLTMKQMIRQLHISKPIPYVMCILGKKYPSTEEEFRRCGLSGQFEPDRAGSRMKLAVPETWETLVSMKGNKAETWEELIDHRKLPFMAMLRNLRNLLQAGISHRHHRWVMSRLTDERTVANSRQFPFAFFSAYEAINIDLDKLARDVAAERERRKGGKSATSTAPATRGRGSARGGRGGGTAGATETRRPKKMQIPKVMPTADILKRYREALDTAVKIATVHNVKPIRGTTVVLCSAASSMRDGVSPARNVGSQRTFQDVGLLLGLMCKYMCEECDFRLFASPVSGESNGTVTVNLRPGTILDNMQAGLACADQVGTRCEFPFEMLEHLIRDRKKVDQLIVIADKQIAPGCEEMRCAKSGTTISDILRKYRQEINPDLLFVSINLNAKRFGMRNAADRSKQCDNDVVVSGFSDAILKYIAERGDGNQLQCIQHIDETKGLLQQQEKFAAAQQRKREARQPSRFWSFMDAVQDCPHEGCTERVKKEALRGHVQKCEFRLVPCPSEGCAESVAVNQLEEHQSKCLFRRLSDAKSGKWRTAKVFVSSTFLDMHGERDVLARRVFPEIRERCRQRQVNFFEVDLRWGITAEESRTGASLETCLDQVDRCRPFFLGMLGARYGGRYDEYKVSGDPRFDWLKDYPKGRSITELEMQFGALANPASAHAVMMLREPSFLDEVPSEHLDAFKQSGDAEERLEELRQRIMECPGLSVCQYEAHWGGKNDDGQPIAGDLERFAQEVTKRLWNAICEVFPDEGVKQSPLEQLRMQHDAHVEERARRFVGREESMKQLIKFADGNALGPLVVHGAPGLGKSALLAAFARKYQTIRPGAVVITHCVGAADGSNDIRATLHRICHELKAVSGTKEDVPESYKELKLAFPRFLESASYGKKVVLVLDGVDQFSAANRAQNMEWLPSEPPIRVVVSAYTRSGSHQALSYRSPPLPSLAIDGLEERERRDLVRALLWEFHKKLDETPSNNQMRTLLRKRESNKPLWLTLACQELRLFGVYEDLGTKINSLPAQLDKLCLDVITRVEKQCTKSLVSRALSLVACSRGGLRESELLTLCARPEKKEASLPRAVGMQLWRALECFLVRSGENIGDGEPLFRFSHQLMAAAVEKRYFGRGSQKKSTHSSLADYYLQAADPLGDRSWQAVSPRAYEELPYHMCQAERRDELSSILTDLRFLQRKCDLGLAFQAVSDYAFAAETDSRAMSFMVTDDEGPTPLESFNSFMTSNVHILAHHPGLLLQQAANQPDGSAPQLAASEALGMSGDKALTWIEWRNKPQTEDACKMTLSGYSDAMMACAFSPDGDRMVCASRDRSLRVWDAQSGTELVTLSGHTNWVVACAFSPDGNRILSASWDNTVKVWDANLGTEIMTLKGHRRRASTCSFSNDGRRALSGSWDCVLKLWDVDNGEEIMTFKGHTKPVNACAFSPEDDRMVSASWDCTLRVWDCETGKTLVVLSGHTHSVRSVAFSPNGRHVVSTSADCTIKVWDARNGAVVNSFTGHAEAVNTVAFSADGKHIVSASDDQTIKVWDALGGSRLQTLMRAQAGSGWANAVDISLDGKMLVSASSDCTATLWDTFSGMELQTVAAHDRSLTSCAFSPWSDRVVTGGEDGVAKVWSVPELKELATLSDHRGGVNGVAFSPDGNWIATTSDDFTAILWNAATYELHQRLDGHSNCVLSASFSPDSRTVVTSGKDSAIIQWNVSDGEMVASFNGHRDWVTQVSFSPNGRRLVSGSWDFNLKVWDVDAVKELHTLSGHSGAVSGCGWSDDGKRVVSSAFDSTLKLWDAVEGVSITTMDGHSQRVNGCVWARCGGIIASCSDDCTVRLWDSVAGTEVTTLHGHSDSIRACAFSPAKKQIVSASEDCTVKVWDAMAERETSGHSQRVSGCGFAPDGVHAVSASRDGTIRMWDVESARAVRLFEGHTQSVNAAVFTRNGKRIVSCSDDATVRVWRPDGTGSPKVLGGHTKSVRDVAVFEHCDVIVSASWDNTVRTWTVDDGKVKSGVLQGHGDWVNACTCHPRAKLVASASHDCTVKLWNVSSARCGSTLHGHSNWVLCCAFASDGATLASGSFDSTVRVWDTELGTSTLEIREHTKRVNAVRFGVHDSLLISASDDTSVQVHDVRSRERVTQFFCRGGVTSIAPGPDGRGFCVGDTLGNVLFLNVLQRY